MSGLEANVMELVKPIWPALFGVSVLALIGYLAKRNFPWRDQGMDFWMPLVLLLITAALAVGLSAAVGCALASTIGKRSAQVWHECWRGKMVSLRSSDGAQGRIGGGLFMVSGYVNSQQVYFYYISVGDDAYRAKRWTPDGYTTVYEEDRKDGEVVQFDAQFKRKALSWFGIPDDDYRMDFHIPKGSVRQQFSLE